jgi:CheY-like chemotaxis protein
MSATVLVVEDNADEAELLRLAAQEAGILHPFMVARSGEEALDLLTKESLRPAAVLLDLKMPGIGGLETLRRVRSRPELDGLLIFVVSSSDLERDKSAASALGCARYFVKPMTFEGYVEMATRIKALLPKAAP